MSKIIVIGCLEETLDTLRYLYSLNVKIDYLITLSKENANKTGISNWVDLLPFSKENQMPLLYVTQYNMKNELDYDLIKKLDPDVVYVIGWQRLIPTNIIDLAKLGFIGFHGSCNFLPWGRGRSPINWSIIENRNRFILHMFFITSGVDDGDIIGVEVFDIQSEETCRSLYYKTAISQARLIKKFITPIIENNYPRYPQLGEIFYYPKRTPDDGKINWELDSKDICRLVRAVTHPYPGAFSSINDKRVNIWRCQNFGDNQLTSDAKIGEVVFVSSNNFSEFVVKAGLGAILITEYESDNPIVLGDFFDV